MATNGLRIARKYAFDFKRGIATLREHHVKHAFAVRRRYGHWPLTGRSRYRLHGVSSAQNERVLKVFRQDESRSPFLDHGLEIFAGHHNRAVSRLIELRN
jgi:hypothetical protein